MKIAILGGAFNPIHCGHIEVARFVLNNTDIKQVWITPSYQLPYKTNIAPNIDRVKMCQYAISKEPNCKICEDEIRYLIRTGTYDFLKVLLNDVSYRMHEFYYIIGMDNAIHFDQWIRSEELKSVIPFIVVSRQGIGVDDKKQWYKSLPHIFLDAGTTITNISSTKIRELLKDKNDNSVSKYVDPLVLKYIRDNNLYER